uniref:Uncharacterized protein n=1 Tax=Tanacetum cinerariifolium TaxID=118510 RepID=A0A6L2L8Z6_TANCI|nr:hypothetical protein [Tanacetum cinerariifolium]
MDDPNITMEEYIRLEEEKARRHGRMFNWQTATFEKAEKYKDEDDCSIDFETEFPAIVFDNTSKSNTTLLSEPTVCPLNENMIDFRISLDESDDEDYTSEKDNDDNDIDIIQSSEGNEVTTPWLRYQIEEYTEGIRHSYKQRLETIWSRPVNRVHVLDFEGLTPGMRQDLVVRLRMVYFGEGQQVFGSHAWRKLFEIRAPLVREFILEFLSTCRMSDTEMGLDVADTLLLPPLLLATTTCCLPPCLLYTTTPVASKRFLCKLGENVANGGLVTGGQDQMDWYGIMARKTITAKDNHKTLKGMLIFIGLAIFVNRNNTLLQDYKSSGKSSVFSDMRIGEQNEELRKLDKKIMRPKLEMRRRWYFRGDVARILVVSRKGVHPISAEKCAASRTGKTKEAVLLIFECSQIRALEASSQKEKLVSYPLENKEVVVLEKNDDNDDGEKEDAEEEVIT